MMCLNFWRCVDNSLRTYQRKELSPPLKITWHGRNLLNKLEYDQHLLHESGKVFIQRRQIMHSICNFDVFFMLQVLNLKKMWDRLSNCNHKDTECSGGFFYQSNFHFQLLFFHFPSCMDATSSLTHPDTQKCTATFYRVRNLLPVSTHPNVLNANDVIVFGLSNELGNTFATATALPMHTNQHMKPLSLRKSSNSNINHLHFWRI